jgi:hypothetical protein
VWLHHRWRSPSITGCGIALNSTRVYSLEVIGMDDVLLEQTASPYQQNGGPKLMYGSQEKR